MRAVACLVILTMLGCPPPRNEAVVTEEELPGSIRSSIGPSRLSEYSLFVGEMKNLRPFSGAFVYEINSPLFSDYAFKLRMIKLPEGTRVKYDDSEVFGFPDGTVLVKNFYYPSDFSKPEAERRLLETRLLILSKGLWEPLTFIWNEEQTDAFLELAGRSMPVSWIHSDGVLRETDYSVPDLNQCRNCHLKGDRVMPIGTSARQLNRNGQLIWWSDVGLLEGIQEAATVPSLVSYEDENAPVADRARSWLESNCAHCHRPDGQAKTSGLHLSADVTSLLTIGVGKPPVAAGKGSGGRHFSIVPGKPDESILLYRIESADPGIMMPEMGRKLVHKEGIELVRQWILDMR